MDIKNRLAQAIAAFRTTKNGVPDPNSFLRYGSRRMMPSTWTTPEITDEDFYTGYGFAVINKRANRSVVLGKKFLYTDAKEEIIKKANEEGTRVTHPYLDLIRTSIDFSERDFWYDISTYLDLEGVYYLMAVRAVAQGGTRVGKIQKFVLLNPYLVRPVVDSKGNLGGYVENHNNLQREIPKEMIIPIRLLNPFDKNKTYSLADAARDSQFTMKQANDFAREAIDGNLNAPGILSSAIELPDDQFDNFVSRVKNHGRGEPLFGNGAGTVHWEDMQTDLDKAALDKINSINRDTLLAISGLSKTGVGVEESGTGREVSRTQKDDFTENAVMPQIENIIDALNLDYRRYYVSEYQRNGYSIALDNPLETDRDAEKADVEIRDSQFTLLQSLTNAGYSYEIAAKFSKGLIEITDLGEAPKTPVDDTPSGDGTDPNIPPTPDTPPVEPNSYLDKSYNVIYEGYPIPVVQYLEDQADQITPLSEKGSFIYSNVEGLASVRIQKVDQMDNSLIGIVDENSYVKLGEFHENADRVAIIAKLNKRYKNQPVATKKKLDLTYECVHNVYDMVRNASGDQAEVDRNTANLYSSTTAAEERLFQWYASEIAQGNLNPHPTDLEPYVNSMAIPYALFYTVMFPTFASNRVKETAKDLGVGDDLPLVALTEEVKAQINDFARKEATSHINTVKTDIENALAIIRVEHSDPQEIQRLLSDAFDKIQKRRAPMIANNASARIYHLSQYEADLQLLTRAGLLKQAYKELYSLTGDPCPICDYLIATSKAHPVPFEENFVNLGQTIEKDGKKQVFNYEPITSGNVHPNCHCAYKLVIKNIA